MLSYSTVSNHYVAPTPERSSISLSKKKRTQLYLLFHLPKIFLHGRNGCRLVRGGLRRLEGDEVGGRVPKRHRRTMVTRMHGKDSALCWHKSGRGHGYRITPYYLTTKQSRCRVLIDLDSLFSKQSLFPKLNLVLSYL